MTLTNWLAEHWLDLLQSIGIVSGLFFTAYSIRKEDVSRKIANLMAVTAHHHAIWREVYEQPELSRVLDQAAPLDREPLSSAEQLFVTSLIIHLEIVHRLIKAGMFYALAGMRDDIRTFFSFPIPKLVWNRVKSFQDPDFVAFVDSCLAEPAENHRSTTEHSSSDQ